MIAILDEGLSLGDEVVDEVGDTTDDPEGAEGSLRSKEEIDELPG